jgi:hypothetical protein
MPIDAYITDPATGERVKRVMGGALAVAPIHPSLAFNATLGTDDTAVNIIPAKADHVFCMTGLFLTSNKNVDPNTAATVTIYTADAADTAKASALQTLFSVPVSKNSTRDYNPILVEAAEGKWINGETSDDDVFVTVIGYYLKVEG